MKRKCLEIGIILLFVGVTIVPTINFNTVKASQQSVIKERINQRELLFQTICDIANNKGIQRDILKSHINRNGIFNADSKLKTKIITACNQLFEIKKNNIHDTICNIILNPIYHLMLSLFIAIFFSDTTQEQIFYTVALIIVAYIFTGIYKLLRCFNWEEPDKTISVFNNQINPFRIEENSKVECSCNE